MKTAPVWAPHLTHCLREDVYKQLQQCEIPDWVSKKNQFKTDILPLPQSVPYLEPTFEIKTSDLSVECTDLIVKKAAQWDVSVHSLLGGCILSVFASEYGRSLGYKRIIQSPVSFRRFIKEEFKDAFGIYMGIMKQAIDCAPGIDLCTTVKNIHATFKKQIESIELLKGYYQFMTLLLENVEDPETFFYNGPGPDPMDYDFSISNLGKIRLLSDKKGLVVDAHGPVFSAVDGERIFGVSTVNGKLSITMIYDDNCFCSKRADRILEKINQVFSSF
ncbi:MAG: hypothetical protein GX640_23350 [Fibrobacter sp.]|nr:hypothetical protein [Fibrobacter sp.]